MPKDSQISVMPLPFRYHSPYMYVFSPCRVSTRKSTKVFVKCPFTAPVFGQAAQEGKRGGTCRGCMCEHLKARGKCRECRGMEEAAGSREERAGTHHRSRSSLPPYTAPFPVRSFYHPTSSFACCPTSMRLVCLGACLVTPPEAEKVPSGP